MTTSEQVVLARRPRGRVREEDFRREVVTLPPLNEGDAEFETLYISIDPAIRGRLDDRLSPVGPLNEQREQLRQLTCTGVAMTAEFSSAIFLPVDRDTSPADLFASRSRVSRTTDPDLPRPLSRCHGEARVCVGRG